MSKKNNKLNLKRYLNKLLPDFIDYQIKEVIYNGQKTDYLVDTEGHVYSKNYKNSGKFKEMGQFNMKGYLMVNLTINHKYHRLLVHRIVAEAFIPNPENKPEVNHKDGNKRNNKVNNLEWNTHSENIKHAIKNNLLIYKTGEEAYQSTITKKQAIEICKLLEENELCFDEIAEKVNTTRGVVYNIKYGLTWKDISKNYKVQNHNISKQRKPIINKKVSKKLTVDEVINICELLQNSNCSINEISEITGVSKSKIESIRYKNAWNEITKEYNFDHRNIHKKHERSN